MKVFTAQQMRDFDRAAVEEYGIPSIVLMENAALRVVEFLEHKFAPLSDKKIVILCGKGNNGGDGLAIARHLANLRCRILLLHPNPKELRGDVHEQWRMLTNKFKDYAWENVITQHIDWSQLNLDVMDLESDYAKLVDECASCDVFVDALLGTGIREELRAPYPQLISALDVVLNKVSVDVPSGVDANTGKLHSTELGVNSATYTITFAAPKCGFFMRDGLGLSGEIWVGDIGSRWSQMVLAAPNIQTLSPRLLRMALPHRSIDAHKGDAGRVLLLGGSFGMSGAMALAARASLGIGAGLCMAALPEKILPTFAASCLEATSHPLPCDERGRLLECAADELGELWKNVQVVALGPGLGRSEETFGFVRRVVRECPQPLVIDADALHALPAIADEVKNREAPTILTPHPGEMGELMGISAKEVNDDRFGIVEACAAKFGAITVLKGARTLVCELDGEIWVNLSGHPGMASGGSGDVLTGTIAGLLAQTKNALSATQLGVYTHGLAGEIAARTLGNGLVAGDVAAHLPLALCEIETREVERINGRLRKLE